ncbi:MAG: cysteine hydrolase [Nitrospinota bacterium]|nr:cysteine hydrolase [Nitrospinota bacterium]
MQAPLFTSFDEKVFPDHSAIIVVDVQNDFCATDGWMGKGGRNLPLEDIQEMGPRLEKFIDAARVHDVRVVWIRCAYDDVFIGNNQKERTQRRVHGRAPCLSDTWGQEFYILKPKEGEVIVTKHRYDAFEGTNLDVVLKSNGIHTLLMTGCTTECCVESASRHGFFLGYYVVLVDDCCGTFDPALQEGTKRIIDEYFGVVSTAKEVQASWETVADERAAAASAS